MCVSKRVWIDPSIRGGGRAGAVFLCAMFGGGKKVKQLEEVVAQLEEQLRTLRAANSALEQNYVNASEQVESFQAQWVELEQKAEQSAAELASAKSAHEEALQRETSARRAIEEQYNALHAQVGPLQQRGAELEKQLADSQRQLNDAKKGRKGDKSPTSKSSRASASNSPTSKGSPNSGACKSPKAGSTKYSKVSSKGKKGKRDDGPRSPEAPETPLRVITNPIGSSNHGPLSPGGRSPLNEAPCALDQFAEDEEDMFALINGELEEAQGGQEQSPKSGYSGSNFGVPRGLDSASVPNIPTTEGLHREFSRASKRSSKTSHLRVDTGNESRSYRTECLMLRAALEDKSTRVNELEEELEAKLKELVDQGEKNYSLYEKLQGIKNSETDARHELEDLRGMIVREIAGEAAEVGAYKNVPSEELLRVLRQARSYNQNVPARVANVMNEAKSVRRARQGAQGQVETDESVDLFGGWGMEGGEDQDNTAEKKSSKSGILSRVESMRLQTEVTALKQANRRLQARIDNIEVIERTGNAAIESMNHLKRRSEELGQRLRREKDVRTKTENELSKSNNRVEALTKHIEKLMIHLKHEAAAKTIAANEVKAYKKEASILRQRSNILAKKNKSRERMLNELREGSRILEDQLRLMDQKYVQLRAKLDWTRSTSNREVKKIQLEANKLRASFALAYSQASTGQGEGSLFKGLLGGDDDDSCSDDSDDSGSSGDENDSDDEQQHGGQEVRATTPETFLESKQGRSEDATRTRPGNSKSLAEDSLPAIESIIPMDEDRYQPRQ